MRGPEEINMTRCQLAFACLVALMSSVHPVLAAGKCQDIPIRVTLYNDAVIDTSSGATTPRAVRSDGGGEYTTASIQVCSGTYDAVTNVTGTKRTFTYVFPRPLAGSVIDGVPTWVPGAFAVSGWINIRNILYNKGSNQAFATMAGSTFTLTLDRATYRLGFKGQSASLPNAPNLHDPADTPGDNTPLSSSPVLVHPNYPAVCGAGSMPTWLVRATSLNDPGTSLEVATLHKIASTPHGREMQDGQYVMPFEMFIEALKCFPY